jgi:hypothetical protein|nr:MAG TPA: hypothetical protein [Caudoviricetes sp.]
MFKVGQIVTAKKLGIYGITDYMKPLKVITSSNNFSLVKPLWDNVMTYDLDNKNLRVMLESEILHKGDIIKIHQGRRNLIAKFISYTDYGIYARVENLGSGSFSMNTIQFDKVGKKGLYVKV